MYSVQSIAALTKLLKRPQREMAEAKAVENTETAQSSPTVPRTAIFVIHGISPIQRYAIQDQFADGLLAYLQATGNLWSRAIHWPKNNARADITPSAVRIYETSSGMGPDASTEVYDVYEGYWSPLSKGKTSIASVLQWLFNITFLASSSTADLPSDWKKLRWDVSYLGALLLAIGALVGIGLRTAYESWKKFATLYDAKLDEPQSVSDFIADALKLPPIAYVQLALAFLIGYSITQLFAIGRIRNAERKRGAVLRADAGPKGHFQSNLISAAKWHNATLVFFIAALVAAIAGLAAIATYESQSRHGQYRPDVIFGLTLLVVVSFAFVQCARFLADFVVENVLGDIQIYTTHDTNSEFFAIRNEIIDTVTRAMLGVVKSYDAASNPAYEAIHIAAHSLGSTIGLDVIMRLSMLVREGSVSPLEFSRIRTFITFGTALEKTKFFFDVNKPTMSAAHDQWDADVYGSLFAPIKVPTAIQWVNLWYERDIVANDICTYTSDVAPGSKDFTWGQAPQSVCASRILTHKRPFYRFVHGDYLSDEEFWKVAGSLIR